MDRQSVTRYVVTHIGRHNTRILAHPARGRWTYATPQEAQARINAEMENNSVLSLSTFYGLPLEVRPVPCDPESFDPITIFPGAFEPFDWPGES